MNRKLRTGVRLEGAIFDVTRWKTLKVPNVNNRPYADKQILESFKMLKKQMQQTRKIQAYYTNLHKALKLRLRTQKELDDHRREGHAQYSPDCLECKRGAAKQRSHQRLFRRQSGELNVDIERPYDESIPITDGPMAKQLWPM